MTPLFPFDALLSVQYYEPASQRGEIEADMALHKWLLCGAERAFDKDEGPAWTFAVKAAHKGLPSAEFALSEVGIGGLVDIINVRKSYTRVHHGNHLSCSTPALTMTMWQWLFHPHAHT